MRITKMTLETEEEITLVAEGRAIQETNVNIEYGVRTLPRDESGWVRKEHDGRRTIVIAIKAVCTYWVDKKGKPKPGPSSEPGAIPQLED